MRRLGLALGFVVLAGAHVGCGAPKAAPETALDVQAHDPTPEVVPPAEPTANEKEGVGSPAPPPTASAPSPSDATEPGTAELSSQLDQLDVQMLQVLNQSGSGAAPLSVLQAGPGGGTGGGALVGGGGGAMVSGGGGLGGLAGSGSSGGPPLGPVGKVAINGPAVTGKVANASSVTAGMTAGFRRCYNRGLTTDPSATGKIKLDAQIGAQGEVLSVTATPTGTLPGTVVSCVKARIQYAVFAAPETGSARITLTATFTPAP